MATPIPIEKIQSRKYGRLIVLHEIERKTPTKRRMRCLCDCGKIVDADLANLRHKKTYSCGCYNVDQIKLRTTKHKMTKTPLYTTWKGMVERCSNPKHKNYIAYKGLLCERWRDFITFKDDVVSSIGGRPYKKTLDRINNEKGYEPGNVRWATQSEQCRNKSNNRIITWKGESKCLSDWADETGISVGLLGARLDKLKWPTYKALSTPVKHR